MTTRIPRQWVGTWATAVQPALGEPTDYGGQTLRLIIRTSIGGEAVRVRVSNAYGREELEIGHARVAERIGGSAAVGRGRELTVDGRQGFVIPPGESVLTDPADLEIGPLTSLAVELHLPRPTKAETDHFLALQTSSVLPAGTTITSWPFLTGVDVRALSPSGAIVVLGDSIAEGAASTPDTNRRWPDLLAARLQMDARTQNLGVLNLGLMGNRLVFDSPADRPFHGRSGLARLKGEALSQAGVSHVIVQLGLNDIGFPGSVTPVSETVSANDLIAGYRRLIACAREAGVRLIGTTISPFAEAISAEGFYTPVKDTVREAFNAWIRTTGDLDGIVDVDRALRDPERPSLLRPAFDSGDHMHPNDAGHQAIAEAIDLALFELPVA